MTLCQSVSRCESCRDMIQEYVEGCCPCDVARDVETHLAACADCRVEYTAAKALAGALDALPGLDVPETFSRAVCERIACEDKRRRHVVAGAASCVMALALLASAALAGPGLLVEGARAAAGFAGFTLSALTSALVFLAGKITYALDAAAAVFFAARAVGETVLPAVLWTVAALTAAAFAVETAGVALLARGSANHINS